MSKKSSARHLKRGLPPLRIQRQQPVEGVAVDYRTSAAEAAFDLCCNKCGANMTIIARSSSCVGGFAAAASKNKEDALLNFLLCTLATAPLHCLYCKQQNCPEPTREG